MEELERTLENIDHWLIRHLKRLSVPLGRAALFVVFFWFGALKVIYASPANPLIENLLTQMLPAVPFASFIIFLGIYEMLIGMTFLIRGLERLAIALLFLHMITTFLPLIFLPEVAWQSFLTPTLEGQYIIKNLVIIAVAIGIAAHLHPLHLLPNKKQGNEKS